VTSCLLTVIVVLRGYRILANSHEFKIYEFIPYLKASVTQSRSMTETALTLTDAVRCGRGLRAQFLSHFPLFLIDRRSMLIGCRLQTSLLYLSQYFEVVKDDRG